jgi:branched-chain amino acid transport system permease protein
MPASIYKIDPEKDRIYAEEFRRTPVGHHSPGLQRVLNVFRGEPLRGKYVLVCTKPHEEWQLARLSGERGKPPQFENKFYRSLEEAEWDVFKRRWKDFTGEELKLPTEA